MNRFLISVIMMIVVGLSTACADNYSHDASALPASAQSVIKKNFKAGVSLVKIDKDLGFIKDYEVVLKDGTEIKFDSDGNWEEVEVSADKNVPASFLVAGIRSYLAANFKGVNVVGIEKNRKDYEVKLANGIDLKFDRSGKFLRYDD